MGGGVCVARAKPQTAENTGFLIDDERPLCRDGTNG
jgi:hypothetical protein